MFLNKPGAEISEFGHNLDREVNIGELFRDLEGVIKNSEEIYRELHSVGVTTEQQDDLVEKFAKEVSGSQILTIQFYQNILTKHPLLEKYVEHDLNNVMTPVLTYCGLLHDGMGDLDMFKELETMLFYYLRALEDIFLRCLDGASISVQKEFFDHSRLEEFAQMDYYLASRRNAEVKHSINFHIDDHTVGRLKDKKPFGYEGVVDNFILNVLRNAFRPKVGADYVTLTFSLDESSNELVYQVQDNGGGIPAQVDSKPFFEPDEFGQIGLFKPGQSGSGSTGLGLADADIRLPQNGMKVSVCTKRQDGSSNFWRSSDAVDSSNLLSKLDRGTLFEVRVPLRAVSELLEQQSTPGLAAA